MTFKRLEAATKIIDKDTKYFEIVMEWSRKRESLHLQLADLPTLTSDYKNRSTSPYLLNPSITLTDQIPVIRLKNACEAVTNSLYGMAEIAAQFANRVSNGELPSSFNKIRKSSRVNCIDAKLIQALGDLQWYERVREARTEWAHYSTAFIGNDEAGEPVVVIQPYRRHSDKQHFCDRINFPVIKLIEWTRKAIDTIDNFGGYLLEYYVLSKFDPDAELTVPKCDENGVPIFLDDKRFDVEKTTVREYFSRWGIEFTVRDHAE